MSSVVCCLVIDLGLVRMAENQAITRLTDQPIINQFLGAGRVNFLPLASVACISNLNSTLHVGLLQLTCTALNKTLTTVSISPGHFDLTVLALTTLFPAL